MKTIQKAILLLMLGCLGLAGGAFGSDGGDCTNQGLIPLGEPPAEGQTTFCVDRNGLRAEMKVKGLVPGDAYTVWWVYFDDPSACETPGFCDVPDFEGPDPLGVVGRFDSGVARSNGRASFRGRVRGMVPRSGSEIWLLIFGHGPADYADTKHLARQLLTPEDPFLGAPHLGIVGQEFGFDVAINIFLVD